MDFVRELNIPFCFLVASALSIALALYFKLFLVSKPEGERVRLFSPLIALILYIVVSAFVPKYVSDFLSRFHMQMSSYEFQAFTVAITTIACFVILAGFLSIHDGAIRQRIVGDTAIVKKVLKGILWAIFAYPLCIMMSEFVHVIVNLFGPFSGGEQLPLALLKSVRGNTFLFWFLILMIVTVIPAVEELFFRGFLQNSFADWFGAHGSIFLTSTIFALFHYSGSQQMTNIELMAGLFLASYIIGICYFKERSLIASCALHASFNAFSIIFFLLGISFSS